jgi:hypothetical protein
MDHVDNDGFIVYIVLLINLFFNEFHSKKRPTKLREVHPFPKWNFGELLWIYFVHTSSYILFSSTL